MSKYCSKALKHIREMLLGKEGKGGYSGELGGGVPHGGDDGLPQGATWRGRTEETGEEEGKVSDLPEISLFNVV